MKKIKYCLKCQKTKFFSEFYKDNHYKDNYHCWCKKYFKNRYQNNKEKVRLINKKWKQAHKKEIKEYAKKYNQSHKKQRNKQLIEKRKINVNFKIRSNLRTRLYYALKGNPKLSTTMKLVGCSIEQLKQHLQSKFTKGMTWKNYGKWHIDHIRPCCKFDLSKSRQQKKCFNYKNLQPLWAEENWRKYKR